MTYNDQAWNHADHFQDEWIISIEEQGLIPIDAVIQAKSWFEYLGSRYRCKTCNMNAKLFKMKPQFLPRIARDEGVLFDTLEENREAIVNHEKSATHNQIIKRRMDDQVKAGLYEDITYFEDSETMSYGYKIIWRWTKYCTV